MSRAISGGQQDARALPVAKKSAVSGLGSNASIATTKSKTNAKDEDGDNLQILPPMLSPSLPPWLDEFLPKEMLSPTLPPLFAELPNDIKQSKAKSPTQRRTIDRDYDTSESEPDTKKTSHNNQKKTSEPTRASKLSSVNSSNGSSKDVTKKKRADRVDSTENIRLSSPSTNTKTNDNTTTNNGADGTKRKLGNAAAPAAESNAPSKKKRNASDLKQDSRASSKEGVSEQREKYYRLLRNKMHKWIGLAREQKHAADRATNNDDHTMAAVLNMDSLICFVVGFDYEDRADSMLKRDPTPNSWATLVQHITRLVLMFENHKLNILAGVCYQIRALIHLRMITCYRSVIKHKMKLINSIEPDIAKSNKAAELVTLNTELQAQTLQLIAAQESSSADFMRGLDLLSIEHVRADFPRTWKERAHSPQPANKREGGYRPMENEFYLPLHTFSSLQEAAAFGYKITKEWADINEVTIEWALEMGLK